LTVRDLYVGSALRKALPDSIHGVVVVEVDPAGPARLARVRVGQIVLEVNRQATPTADAFDAAVAAIAPGSAAVALVYDPITGQRALVAIVPDKK
jgi:S1-C subfamily serine protease